MSSLALAIYDLLRRRARQSDPRITYGELARELRERAEAFEHITHRSHELYAALWEIGAECRRLGLPPLPALVVRADTRRPGDAYYEGMPWKYRGQRIAAWQRDLDAVRRTKYPRGR
jgi:hypothetical protein